MPEVERFLGSGVYYGGPISEAHAMADKDVFVAGGANSAGQAALYLARFARRVTMVVRADSLEASMSQYLIDELAATTNVELRLGNEVVGGGGQDRLDHLVIRNRHTGEEDTLHADGLFILIGADPHTDWLPPELARDGKGFLLTGANIPAESLTRPEYVPDTLETSIPGVFAAGDVRSGSIRRVASAVGEGSIAIQQVHRFLQNRAQASAIGVD